MLIKSSQQSLLVLQCQHDHNLVHSVHKIFVALYAIVGDSHEYMQSMHDLDEEFRSHLVVGKALQMVFVHLFSVKMEDMNL